MTATNSYTKTMWYNSSASVFSAYRADQSSNVQMTKVALYRKTEGEAIPSTEDPILEEETFGAYPTTGSILYVKANNIIRKRIIHKFIQFIK